MAWARYPDKKLYKDSNKKNVRTDDYEHLPVELWNSSTIMAYLDYLNNIHFGKTPTDSNVRLTRIRIEEDITNYGADVLKTWMEAAIKAWGGSARFPTVSYNQLRKFKWEGFIEKAIEEVHLKTFKDPAELTLDEFDSLF